jgi:hypothetical protein
MVAESLLAGCSTAGGQAQALPLAVLQLLPPLIEAHADACAAATRALITSPALCSALAASLELCAQELGAPSTTLLLRLMCAVFGQGGKEAGVLAAELGHHAFMCATQLLAAVASAAGWQEAGVGQDELREVGGPSHPCPGRPHAPVMAVLTVHARDE